MMTHLVGTINIFVRFNDCPNNVLEDISHDAKSKRITHVRFVLTTNIRLKCGSCFGNIC